MEENRFQVTRDLKREFYLLFKNNDVQIPFTQVTVNPEDEKKRPKATPEQIVLSLNEQRKLRGLEQEPAKPKKTKNKVIAKVKESMNKTVKELEE